MSGDNSEDAPFLVIILITDLGPRSRPGRLGGGPNGTLRLGSGPPASRDNTRVAFCVQKSSGQKMPIPRHNLSQTREILEGTLVKALPVFAAAHLSFGPDITSGP